MNRIALFSAFAALGILGSSAVAQESPKVQVTIKVSDKLPSFKDQRLVVMLYHNHPNDDDRAPTAVDRYVDAKFSHQKGKETVIKLVIGQNAKLKGDVEYSVTVNVFQGLGTITHAGQIDGEPGPFSVVSSGHPDKITVNLRPEVP